MGAGSPASIKKVAALGDNLLLDQFASVEEIGERIALFKAEVEARGRRLRPDERRRHALDQRGHDRRASSSGRCEARIAGRRRIDRLANRPDGPSARDLSDAELRASALYGPPDAIAAKVQALRDVGVGVPAGQQRGRPPLAPSLRARDHAGLLRHPRARRGGLSVPGRRPGYRSGAALALAFASSRGLSAEEIRRRPARTAQVSCASRRGLSRIVPMRKDDREARTLPGDDGRGRARRDHRARRRQHRRRRPARAHAAAHDDGHHRRLRAPAPGARAPREGRRCDCRWPTSGCAPPLPRPGKILACIANYWEHGALDAAAAQHVPEESGRGDRPGRHDRAAGVHRAVDLHARGRAGARHQGAGQDGASARTGGAPSSATRA